MMSSFSGETRRSTGLLLRTGEVPGEDSSCLRRQRPYRLTVSVSLKMHAGFNAWEPPCCHPQRVGFRVLIVDDNASFLDAARTLLEAEGLSVIALASTGSDAVAFSFALKPALA